MARPLTGQINESRSGRFGASVPVVTGSRKRHRDHFDTREEAAGWLLLACACVNRGEPVPSPIPVTHWLETLAREWHERVYEVEQRAQPGRAGVEGEFVSSVWRVFWDSRRWRPGIRVAFVAVAVVLAACWVCDVGAAGRSCQV